MELDLNASKQIKYKCFIFFIYTIIMVNIKQYTI